MLLVRPFPRTVSVRYREQGGTEEILVQQVTGARGRDAQERTG